MRAIFPLGSEAGVYGIDQAGPARVGAEAGGHLVHGVAEAELRLRVREAEGAACAAVSESRGVRPPVVAAARRRTEDEAQSATNFEADDAIDLVRFFGGEAIDCRLAHQANAADFAAACQGAVHPG